MAFARVTDPATSHDAAQSVSRISETQKWVLRILDGKPMCDEMLVDVYGWMRNQDESMPKASAQSLRSRRAELTRLGLVEYAGFDELMTTGRYGRVWKLAING